MRQPKRDTTEGLLTAAQACALLDIKRATLYAYVSRGAIRAVTRPGGRTRLYVEDDVQRVRARSHARKGHGAVAAGALRWGEPVLDSSITEISQGTLCYRGHDVVAMAERGVAFERVTEILWGHEARRPEGATGPAARGNEPVGRLLSTIAELSAAGVAADDASTLLWSMAAALCEDAPGSHEGSLAGFVASRLCPDRGDEGRRAIDAALVVTADHELNVSTFAARIAASAGAELVACVGAALYVFTGARHGGACQVVGRWLSSLPRAREARAGAVAALLAAGQTPPGFGHRLYPDGDPRARPLLALARRLSANSVALEAASEVSEATGLQPCVDYALVALTAALGLSPSMATGLFALGRSAGWVAHVYEQRQAPDLLRPRARYVGAR